MTIEFQVGGKTVLVDDEDAWAQKRTWRLLSYNGSDNKFRVYGYIYGRQEYLHRIVVNLEPGDPRQVDHINGNALDNRKANLRIVSRAQNLRNVGVTKSNKTGVKGVFWEKERQKFRAQICIDRKNIYLGRFDTLEEAFEAYREAAMARFNGEYEHPTVTNEIV